MWAGEKVVKTLHALGQTCTIHSLRFIYETRHFSPEEDGWRKEAKKMCHFLYLIFSLGYKVEIPPSISRHIRDENKCSCPKGETTCMGFKEERVQMDDQKII